MKTIVKAILPLLILFLLLSCSSALATPEMDTTKVVETAVANAWTNVQRTQTALPSITPTPPSLLDSIPVFVLDSPTRLPSATITPTSLYESDHEAIRKVIAAYFDHLYLMHNTFQVDGLGDSVSTSEAARGFREMELRSQAYQIVWARRNLLRYASYDYDLHYSEIVVFDGGQMARANFTEGNSIVYDVSIRSGIVSQSGGVKHIMILKKESDGWKIIYDVHDDMSHRSLYAPTPLPDNVLKGIDKNLMDLGKGQGGPALPGQGKTLIPSDPSQLERWKEYESALAEKLLPRYPRENVLCEWEVTEKREDTLNVWAVCMTTIPSPATGKYYFPAASLPAIIHLNADESVQSIDIPEYGDQYLADIYRLFPNDPWTSFPDVFAMERHLNWRRVNRTEPPLVVLNATAILTPTITLTPTPTHTP